MLIKNNEYIRCDTEDIVDGVVTIPQGVTTIGKEAFAVNDNIKKVKLPDGVKEIGYRAFYFCSNLLEINLPESVEIIEPLAFYACDSLKDVKLPKNLKFLGDNSFGCTAIECIEIPKSIEVIYEQTFIDCQNLKKVVLNEGFVKIMFAAFLHCECLQEINLPSTLKQIGYCVFDGCNIKTIEISKNTKLTESIFGNRLKTIIYK